MCQRRRIGCPLSILVPYANDEVIIRDPLHDLSANNEVLNPAHTWTDRCNSYHSKRNQGCEQDQKTQLLSNPSPHFDVNMQPPSSAPLRTSHRSQGTITNARISRAGRAHGK